MGSRHHLPTPSRGTARLRRAVRLEPMPKLARAEGRDPRLLIIVLRGALDGLAAVAPVGDPDWIGLRGDRALMLDGKTPALPLDGFFALNPAMPNLHRLYKARRPSIVHAVATPYRERSHFDGQDVLESGFAQARRASTPAGSTARWLALAADGRVDPRGSRAPSASARSRRWWCAARRRCCPGCRSDCCRRATTRRPPARSLSAHRSETCARARGAHATSPRSARAGGIGRPMPRRAPALLPAGIAQRARLLRRGRRHRRALSRQARRSARRRAGLRSAGIRTSTKARRQGQLANLLGALDGALAAIETNMGDAWRETVVAVVTEFGRTARINGTEGTDHGTATVALLVGGALKGGRVIADWPGLKQANSTRSATSSRPPICVPCSRACSGIICASTSACWQ